MSRDGSPDPEPMWWAAAMGVCVLWLFLLIGDAPVRRTQEARVAEVARQMVGQPIDRWLIPRINGEVRLRKPPMPYWTSAMSYEVFGVGEGAARVPAALAACVAAAAVAGIGATLGHSRAGRWGALIFLTTFMGERWARLAETDMPATAGLMVAWWLWVAACKTESAVRRVMLATGAGVGLGLGLLNKQGPPLMFAGLMVASVPYLCRLGGKGSWKRWLRAGCVTLAVAGVTCGWWYYIALRSPWGGTLFEEAKVVTSGRDHNANLLQYIPQFLGCMMPWTAVPLVWWLGRRRVAPVYAGRASPWRLLVPAFVAMAIPLAVLGNVQVHYLLPVVTLASLGAGLMLDDAAGWPWRLRAFANGAMGVMTIGLGLSLPALRLPSGEGPDALTWIIGSICVALGVWLFCMRERLVTWAAVAVAASAWGAGLSVLGSRVLPNMERDNVRDMAWQVAQKVQDRPLMFIGLERSLPLCFALRREIRAYEQAMAKNLMIPDDVVLIDESPVSSTSPDPASLAAPKGFKLMSRVASPARVFTLYERIR